MDILCTVMYYCTYLKVKQKIQMIDKLPCVDIDQQSYLFAESP